MKNDNLYKEKISLTVSSSSKFLAFCLVLAALCYSSCKKFIAVPVPNSQLVTASVFDNDGAATSAITNIYTQMFNNSESYMIARFDGWSADELSSYSVPKDIYYVNNLNENSGGGEWTNAYYYIYQANAAITGLQQYPGTSPVVKSQLLGEAYFIRAFWHFYLTETFGDVPVALTIDYTVTSRLSRTPRVQVMEHVIADLQTAKGLLSNNYIDASDTASTIDRVRPNKSVATALLARAYLYLGDYSKNTAYYSKADSAASAVIANPEYSLGPLTGPNEVFTANSSEAIWQLYTPQPNGVNTIDGQRFILLSEPSGSNSNASISPQLLSAFEPSDQRKVNWIGTITENGTIYYFPYKYKIQTGGTPLNEYTMVLRLAEQYLIRAEAKVELGDATAVNDLNAIRNRAGLSNYSGTTDKPTLLAAILHERQVELFTEWGHRWYDLGRAVNTASSVNINTVMGSPGNVCQYKGGTWSPYKALYPIPYNDIKLDNNLTQNQGY